MHTCKFSVFILSQTCWTYMWRFYFIPNMKYYKTQSISSTYQTLLLVAQSAFYASGSIREFAFRMCVCKNQRELKKTQTQLVKWLGHMNGQFPCNLMGTGGQNTLDRIWNNLSLDLVPQGSLCQYWCHICSVVLQTSRWSFMIFIML